MAPTQNKPPAMLSLKHPETGHSLSRTADEGSSAVHGFAAQDPRKQRAARNLAV